MSDRYDLAVVGAGSGGIGAALAAARLGLKVLLIEKAGQLGGTAVRAGVHCWEMGAGGTGLPFDLYRRLRRLPNAVGIYSFGRHCLFRDPASGEPPYPGSETVIDPTRTYADTLRRCGARSMGADEAFCREHFHGVPFEPEAYCRVAEEMLAETGRSALLTGVGLAEVEARGGHVEALRLDDGRTVAAETYVDATAEVYLAIGAGAEAVIGQESRATYGEPQAPEAATDRTNGVTLLFRASPRPPGEAPRTEPLPEGVPAECWWQPQFPLVCVNHYPGGDLNVNMLPTMEGSEFRRLPHAEALAECRRRVRAEWHHVQQVFPEFQGYRLSWVAPELGVREGPRVVGEYVLTEHDLRAGLSGQRHADIIAVADHALDTHDSGSGGCGELQEPYGIPYRCLIPRGFGNLLVACRGASFSSLAASSCRLARTMMQLGQAAGSAAAIAKRRRVSVREAPPEALRECLREQHVQLEWPLTDDLRRHLRAEGAT